jgi:HD-GYP domain-containing protein (c-di-GMP phosphodiesterase class II)
MPAGRYLGEAHIRTYVGGLLGAATALAAAWSYQYEMALEPEFAVGALALAACMLLGDAFPIRISGRVNVGVWDVGLIVAVVVLGPTWAALVALPSAFFVGRRDWLRTAYEVGHSVTIAYLAGIVFSFASAPLLVGTSSSTAQVVYGTFATAVVLIASNKVIVAVLMKIKHGQTFGITWKELNEPYLLSDAINVLTAGLSVLALLRSGPLAALVVVAGSIGSQVLVYRSREQLRENDELRTRVGSLEESVATSNNTFGTMIIQDLGRRDGYTDRHAAASAVYAADLAREMKLDDTRAEQLRVAGLLHNIGLFGLPEELLLATGKLNSIAQSRLAEHPARGEEALAAIPEFEEMASWVRWHHERPDGRGYPDKLRGAWIPLEAKILSVAQAYAAMVLDQPRRPGMSFAEAREKLGAGIDTEFDGIVVRAILRILETESEGYRMADDHRFMFPTPDHRRRAMPIMPESGLEALEDGVRGLPR